MPIMEISVIPVGTKTTSVSKFVASAIKILKEYKGIKYEITSMGTIVESDSLRKLLDIAEKMHEGIFKEGAKRVLTSLKIDDRRDKKISMESKVKSVKEKLRQS